MTQLVGHIRQQHLFRQLIAAKQLSHAYIFSGPEGIGKKEFAKELARGLLCQERRFFAPCDCPSCRQVAEKAHPDYYLFDTSDDLKIDNIRKVSEISEMSTYSGGWKIIIFDNAHLLCQAGADSANALLKTLEEPGENTLFILISHKLGRILPTIQSRCLNIGFEPLDNASLKQILQDKELEGEIEFAGGSVSQAVMLHEVNAGELKSAIDRADLTGLGNIVLGAGNKARLLGIASIMQQYYTDLYKQNSDPETMVFIQYLSEFIRRLDYNVNMSLMMLDLYVKISELLQAQR